MISRLVLAAASLGLPWTALANSGPYDARFVAGGVGIERELPADSPLLRGDSTWSVSGWVHADRIDAGAILLSLGGGARTIEVDAGGRIVARTGNAVATSAVSLKAGEWTHVVIVRDRRGIRFFVNGKAAGSGAAADVPVDARIAVAPVIDGRPHFSGALVGFGVTDTVMMQSDAAAATANRPDFSVVHIWQVGKGWEWQNRANTGLWRPQDPWTLPQSRSGPGKPVAAPVPAQLPLAPVAPGRWQVNGWTLAAAPQVREGGEALSRPGPAKSGEWFAATVPGTVLKTLVDRGVYPDPYYGLNNMAIPESLARQDYWYRAEFDIPAAAAGKRTEIVLNGVNYAGEIWINGVRHGTTKGAFIRGTFAFVPVAGRNAIAIRVSPPPHPGTPHEESIAAGPGENGGQMAIDGPTFVATEGWDWIPGIRDRNTGLWQPVELRTSGPIEIGDPHIVTDLPLPRIDSADVYVDVPITNHGTSAAQASVSVAFDTVAVARSETLAAGETKIVRFSPQSDAALRIANPKLWWPNGYGDPTLHTMRIGASVAGTESDARDVRFGIREISYDLGLMDSKGRLERVNVQTTDGKLAGERLVDVTHPAIWQTPKGFVESLTRAGEASPAVTKVTDYAMPEPHLTIRVNGVKIAARGGNWGMDDAMKQSARARLEPYFRLQRDAHMNVIRNWMGTNNQPEFFDLADEYGMMVFNDFWQSTQNFQVEPQDPQLFLANARDTISRFRNHPSIVLWFGRNEGVPYPLLNEGLDDLVFELDGTRWFSGSSNVVNLQGSGPYNYRPPEGYFTDLASGFSVETGSPSLATLESIEASVPEGDRWPISDTLAYHDWHFGGNGDVKTFMDTLDRRYGAGTSLADFERKAQLLNVETYKAMFEGLTAHLWTKNSGRLLWMTHPAWPSNHWQIYSWDYDTHGSYYGAKKGTEPLHIQLNLPDNVVAIVNTTQVAERGLTARTRITDLDGTPLWSRDDRVDVLENRTVSLAPAPLEALFASHPMLLVDQQLLRADGSVASRNFYWRGRDDAAHRALGKMPTVRIETRIETEAAVPDLRAARVQLRNTSGTPALNVKLTLVDAAGKRILPAFYSDNYISLLPGEERDVRVEWPAKAPNGDDTPTTGSFTIRGWNVAAEAAR